MATGDTDIIGKIRAAEARERASTHPNARYLAALDRSCKAEVARIMAIIEHGQVAR